MLRDVKISHAVDILNKQLKFTSQACFNLFENVPYKMCINDNVYISNYTY